MKLFQFNPKPKASLNTPNVDYKGALVLMVCLCLTNLLTYHAVMEQPRMANNKQNYKGLYLIEQAKPYLHDVGAFERKVRKVSNKLSIPPEWLMAVMHSESRFDASVANQKGSGATGLIQWMPATAKEFKVTTKKLRNMNHVDQLDYVYAYLNAKRNAHKQYETLTDLYLAILYPRAIGEEYCYTLYAQPSKAYTMNIGLDKDKDGRVTVQDIDKHLRRLYPTAYHVTEKEPMYAKFFPFSGGKQPSRFNNIIDYFFQ